MASFVKLSVLCGLRTSELLPPWVGFAFIGKNRIRPLMFLDRRSCGSRDHRPGVASPIRRGGVDTPDVAGLVQCQTYEPVLPFSPQRCAVGDLRRHTDSAGQFFKLHGRSRIERSREPHTASLWIHDQGVAVLGKGRIDAGHAQRDLRPNPGASPRRFVGLCNEFHGWFCMNFKGNSDTGFDSRCEK